MKYSIVYSKRKTIGLKVGDGGLTVFAPRGTSAKHIEAIVNKHRAWIENALRRDAAKNAIYADLDDERIKALKREAEIYFREKCAHYASVMGLSYSKMSITSAKTRFGSCSSRKTICFSYRLMLYPEAAREYVIVHELAHLLEMNHSAKFYKIIEKYMPDYKERKGLLKIKA